MLSSAVMGKLSCCHQLSRESCHQLSLLSCHLQSCCHGQISLWNITCRGTKQEEFRFQTHRQTDRRTDRRKVQKLSCVFAANNTKISYLTYKFCCEINSCVLKFTYRLSPSRRNRNKKEGRQQI